MKFMYNSKLLLNYSYLASLKMTQILILSTYTLWVNSVDDKFMTFNFFLDIRGSTFPKEKFHMKCQLSELRFNVTANNLLAIL